MLKFNYLVRSALFEAPENVATLLRVVITRLSTLISDHTFPSASVSSVTSLATSLIKSRSSATAGDTTKQVLNCLRLLQRVLPVIFELDSETNVFEAEVLWKREQLDQDVHDPQTSNASQFVIEDEDDDEEEEETGPTPQPSSTTPQSQSKKELPSLAENLFGSLVDLLFCCGFTLPAKVKVDHHKINYVIWSVNSEENLCLSSPFSREKGVGSTSDFGPNSAYDNNKVEVLRLLLVLLSRQIYIPSGALLTKPSLYSIHFVQKTPRRSVLTILCSLLNTAMNFNSAPQNTMEGLAGLAGKLPYNHLVIKGEDTRANLVSLCLQVLCVVLDFQSGEARDSQTGPIDNPSSTPTTRTNAFRYFLAKLV